MHFGVQRKIGRLGAGVGHWRKAGYMGGVLCKGWLAIPVSAGRVY